MNGFEPDGRWFGQEPEVVFAADGPAAASLVPHVQEAIRTYAHREHGSYRAWLGPNSNTFIAAILDALPGLPAVLPPTAIGKDYPHDRRWLRRTASRSGFRLTFGGYAALTLGWVEGIELSLLGLVVGLDLRRPALKLPGLGRLGLSAQLRQDSTHPRALAGRQPGSPDPARPFEGPAPPLPRREEGDSHFKWEKSKGGRYSHFRLISTLPLAPPPCESLRSGQRADRS